MVDLRSRARPPRRASVAFELLGGLVAEEFHRVPALDQRPALRGQALQFDRANFGAVLLLLAAKLRLFVVVELALDPADGAMEEIDRRPNQIFEVGFETSIGERRDERVENVGDRAGSDVGVGQGPWIRLVLKRAVAIELEFSENAIRSAWSDAELNRSENCRVGPAPQCPLRRTT
jgi:hypothetical protein